MRRPLMLLLLLAAVGAIVVTGQPSEAADPPVYVSGAFPVMGAIAAKNPTVMSATAPTGCAATARPLAEQDQLPLLTGGPYVAAGLALGVSPAAGCRPGAVTGRFTQQRPGPADTAPVAGVPAGTTLTRYTGPSTITVAGTVLDGMDIRTGLTIQAPNVTIRRSQLSGTDHFGILTDAPGLTVTDTTVVGFDNALGGDGYTATRVDVHGQVDDGFKVSSNDTITDSYCHDLAVGTGSHSDCAQIQDGVVNVVLRGNWFHPVNPEANAALFMAPDLGPSTAGPVLIEDNWFGGGNYTLYCVDGDNGKYRIGNITIRNNRFFPDARYGPASINVPITESGNTIVATGKPITLR